MVNIKFRRSKKEITPYYILRIVSGDFITTNNEVIKYRVSVKLPDCDEEWLRSNIYNRYLYYKIKNGEELVSNFKTQPNEKYKDIKQIKSMQIEDEDIYGNPLDKNTQELPTFYGKSIFDLTYREIQDLATSFGLHEVDVNKNLETLRGQTFIAYLDKILGINTNQNPKDPNYDERKDLKKYQFYKINKDTKQSYIDIDAINTDDYIITNYLTIDNITKDENKFYNTNIKVDMGAVGKRIIGEPIELEDGEDLDDYEQDIKSEFEILQEQEQDKKRQAPKRQAPKRQAPADNTPPADNGIDLIVKSDPDTKNKE